VSNGLKSPEAVANQVPLQKLLSFNDTDAGNAEAFALLYGHRFRFDHTSGIWRTWNDRYWPPDETGEVERAALDTVRQRRIWNECP